MAPNYICPNRDQGMLLPPSLRDWLPEGHIVWFLLDAVERMNLDRFMLSVRTDGIGGAWYEPRMMVTLLIYAYSCGLRSSRKIEQLCESDVGFRVICAPRMFEVIGNKS